VTALPSANSLAGSFRYKANRMQPTPHLFTWPGWRWHIHDSWRRRPCPVPCWSRHRENLRSLKPTQRRMLAQEPCQALLRNQLMDRYWIEALKRCF